jgi:hypothetical protein
MRIECKECDPKNLSMRNPILFLLLSGFLSAQTPSYLPSTARIDSPGGLTYHINPVGGDDSHTGLTKDQAWKSFHPINRRTLALGDRVEVYPGRFDHSLSVAGWGTAEQPITIHFSPGRYDFDPIHARREAYHISNTNGDPDGLKAVALHLHDAKHVRITGPGAVLYARGKMIHVCIDACENITLDGLAFDYHRPTVSEFTVTASGDDFAEFTIHKDSTYSIQDGALLWQGEGWTESGGLGQELDPQTGRVHRLRDPLAGLRFEETKPFQIRAHGTHRLKPGRIYQLRNPFRDYCGAFTRNSRDITWRTVHFRFIHGMGIVSQFTENLTFDSIRIAPDPASGRTTAAWADCIQASGCRGKILVENCIFSGAHDDAINIHGTHLRIVETAPDRREVKVRFIHDQTFGFPAFLPGDDVEFVRWDSLATFRPNRVIKGELLDPRTMLLQLEKPLPGDIRENDVLENVTWTPTVDIRGCTVRHIPTRGFLCTTRRPVIIEDNDFHATHMPGILIENDATGWFESGCVRDMLIRNNRFHHCGEPAIHINPRNSAPNPAVHQNIRIENNTFHLRGKSAIGAKSTTGLRITGNTIHAPQPIPHNAWLHTTDCGDVIVEGNSM